MPVTKSFEEHMEEGHGSACEWDIPYGHHEKAPSIEPDDHLAMKSTMKSPAFEPKQVDLLSLMQSTKEEDIADDRREGAKLVMARAMNDPFTVFPPVMGLLCMTAGGLFQSILAIAFGGVLILGGTVNYYRKKKNGMSRLSGFLMEKKNKVLERKAAQRPGLISRDMLNMGDERGQYLVDLAHKKYKTFCAIIDSKFALHGMTHARFINIGQQSYFAVLDNLSRVAFMRKAQEGISLDYIAKRLADDALLREEREALLKRQQMYHEMGRNIEDLLVTTERVITGLDENIATISLMENSDLQSDRSVHDAIEDLTKLAGLAQIHLKEKERTK